MKLFLSEMTSLWWLLSEPPNFDEKTPEGDVQKPIALLYLFSLQNIFQEAKLYHSEIGSEICRNSLKR